MAHKEIQRQNTIDEIKSYGRQQLVTVGWTGISMSAIARLMEISAPALYRYFDSRDELIRALITDSIEDLVESLRNAAKNRPASDYAGQFWAMAMEYRDWALAHPSDFQMIFNLPVSVKQTSQATAQLGIQGILLAILQVLWAAYGNGRLRPLPDDARLVDEMEFGKYLSEGAIDTSIPSSVIYTGVVAWSRMQGLVTLEFASESLNHVNPLNSVYRQEVTDFMKNVGLDPNTASVQQELAQRKPIRQRVASPDVDDLHVIFGSGPLGLAVMRELLLRGKQVRLINRSGKAPVPEGVELMAGDAFQVEFTRKACQNAAVVYQCAQPAQGAWLDRFAALNAAILDGAAAKGAKFIYGDNLLAYGAVDGIIHEGMTHKPATRKGQIHVRVAEAILTAHRSGRVKVAIGRASDFFGPNVIDAILGEHYLVPLIQGKTVAVLGDPDVPHTFTYIDDFGKTLVELGGREDALGQIWHAPSPPALTQRQLLEMFSNETGLPVKIQGTGRLKLRFMGLYSPEAREKVEVLYQFTKPFVVDSSKFEKMFHIHATPLPEAVRRTINWYRDYMK